MEIFENHFASIDGNLSEINGSFEMFRKGGVKRHINYTSFKNAFAELKKIENPIIIETGSSRWGINSTCLFDKYVSKYGGHFWSVDIHKETVESLKSKVSKQTTMVCDDSVHFLKQWVKDNPNKKVDFVYLDSYDIDWENPDPAQLHGLKEFLAIQPALHKGSLLLIDDTPKNPDWFDSRSELHTKLKKSFQEDGEMPGKGKYVKEMLKNNEKVILLHHMYQTFYKFL